MGCQVVELFFPCNSLKFSGGWGCILVNRVLTQHITLCTKWIHGSSYPRAHVYNLSTQYRGVGVPSCKVNFSSIASLRSAQKAWSPVSKKKNKTALTVAQGTALDSYKMDLSSTSLEEAPCEHNWKQNVYRRRTSKGLLLHSEASSFFRLSVEFQEAALGWFWDRPTLAQFLSNWVGAKRLSRIMQAVTNVGLG